MKITLPAAEGKTLEFASLEDLAKHYGLLADAYRKRAENAATLNAGKHDFGKAEAYDIVCWQLHRTKIEM